MRASTGRAAGRRRQNRAVRSRCGLHGHRDEVNPVIVHNQGAQRRHDVHNRAAQRTVDIGMGCVCGPSGRNRLAVRHAMMALVRPRTGMMGRVYAGRNNASHHKQRQKHGGCNMTRNAHGCAVRVYWIETPH
jgi:hypothetical protein